MIKLNLKIFILKILGSFFLFASIYILSKKMSLYDYGIYETVVRISLLISIFSLYGIPVLITRAKSFHSAKKIYLSTFSTILIINLILVIVSILIIYIFGEDYNSIILIILSGFLYTIYKIRGTVSLKKKKYFVSILSDDTLFNTFLAFSLLFLLFVKVKLTLFSVSLIVLTCRSLTFLILNFDFKIKIIKVKNNISLFKDSTTIFTQSFSQKLVNNLPIILCPFLFSGNEPGIFALSVRLSGIYLILLSGFNIYITPNISEQIIHKKFKTTIIKSIVLFSVIALLIFAINLIFSEYLETIWEEFNNNTHIYIIILAGYLVNLSTGSVGVLLNQVGLEKKQLKINLLSLILLLPVFTITYFYQSLLFYSISISLIIATENILKFKYIRSSLL